MNRARKNLISVALAFFFASAVLCATLAVPGQSLASVSGCSQDNLPMEMSDCEHPGYLCGFDSSSRLISEGAFSSTRSNDSLKTPLGMVVGEARFDSSAYGGPFVGHEHRNASPVAPHKVSIHLYNSVLNL